VYIVIVGAGCIIASAFCANRVSPRVNETMIAPHSPLRVWLDKAVPTADASASTPFGELQDARAGAVFEAVALALLDFRRGVGRRF
jgi:hypothetical protein